jgi:hypothetical protein
MTQPFEKLNFNLIQRQKLHQRFQFTFDPSPPLTSSIFKKISFATQNQQFHLPGSIALTSQLKKQVSTTKTLSLRRARTPQ